MACYLFSFMCMVCVGHIIPVIYYKFVGIVIKSNNNYDDNSAQIK